MKKSLLTAIAIFTIKATAFSQVVITEIMYNPPESNTDSLEFIELQNVDTNGPVDISGYWFSDGFDFVFPPGAVIPAGGFIIVATDSVSFENNFGMMAYQWEQTDALANGGEELGLRSNTGALVDTVTYDDDGIIWPIEPDGNGYSLVLCDPMSDNDDPTNWGISAVSAGFSINGLEVFAHPGEACSTVGIGDDEWITTFIYPNPNHGIFTFESSTGGEQIQVRIIDLSGRAVHSEDWNTSKRLTVNLNLQPGFYVAIIGSEAKTFQVIR